nr:hypothetical protein [Spirochaetales bacterium]
MVSQEAWFRLMKLKKAKQLGISASDEQASMFLLDKLGFKNESGKIDRERYNAFLNDDLPSQNIKISDDEFIEFIQEDLTIQILESVASQGALVLPSAIEESFHQTHDELTVDYAEIPRELAPEPDVTPEYKENFFEEHKEMFAFPETRTVQFVAFPATDYTNGVEVTDEQISQYYEVYKDYDYIAEEPTSDNAEENAEPTYKPLEEVRDDVVAKVTKLLGMKGAAAKAARLFKDLGSGQQSLEELANEKGLPVITSAALSMVESLGDVDEPEDAALWLTQKAFGITATRKESIYNCFTDPISANNAVYIMECIDITPSSLPKTFEEVENLVEKAATKEAIENAYQEKAREILSNIQE